MAFPQSKERGVARCRAGRGVALLGGRGVAGSACAALGLRALESGVTTAPSVAGNAV